MNTNWLFQGVWVLDPARGMDEIGDLVVRAGRIEAKADGSEQVLDCAGLVAMPAAIDLHVHLREPGGEAAETIASGTRSAAAGGVGTVVAMPNTTPPLDTAERVRWQLEEARRHGYARVLPSACLTAGRDGDRPSPLEELAAAGAVAFTDDGSTVRSDELMREQMARAAELGVVVMDHAQDPAAEQLGVMHEGRRSRELGLPGIPTRAEVEIIERDIALCEETGCRLHIQHVTSAQGMRAVAQARRRGAEVSAEVTPHHLALCEDDIPGDDANFKMNPPLRSAADRDALLQALCDGSMVCLATDHAPHTAERKAGGFLRAPFGVIGLETALAVTHQVLVEGGHLDLATWATLWTDSPARILGLASPTLAPGEQADITLLNPNAPWTVDPTSMVSASRNTCFAGRALSLRPVATFHGGRKVWER